MLLPVGNQEKDEGRLRGKVLKIFQDSFKLYCFAPHLGWRQKDYNTNVGNWASLVWTFVCVFFKYHGLHVNDRWHCCRNSIPVTIADWKKHKNHRCMKKKTWEKSQVSLLLLFFDENDASIWPHTLIKLSCFSAAFHIRFHVSYFKVNMWFSFFSSCTKEA